MNRTGRIDRIKSHLGNECYIGSTTGTLEKRMKWHYLQPSPASKKLFDLYGFNNCKIELIREFTSTEENDIIFRAQLFHLERQAILAHPSALNIASPIRTLESYTREMSKINSNNIIEVKCPHCDKHITKRNLKQHIYSTHSDIEPCPNKKVNKTIQCPYCPACVSSNINRHIYTKHSRQFLAALNIAH